MKRKYPNLPAVSYMRLVKQYAKAKKIKIFDVKDMAEVSDRYIETAKILN